MDKKIIRYLSSADEMVIPFSVFYAFLINSLSNILSDKVGDFLNSIICILFLCIGMIVLIFREKRKEKNIQKRIDSSIESRKLKSKYKGLITFVSEAKLNEQNENDYFEKCKHIIEDYKQTQNVNEIAKIRGIGQTFRALDFHLKAGELRYCWFIYSNQSGVNVELMKSFFEIVTNNSINLKFVKIDDPNNSKHIKEKIEEIYRNLPTAYKETDVIADITPRNKPMTAAMILACLRTDRNIEYIEQSENNELIEVDISPKFTGLEL